MIKREKFPLFITLLSFLYLMPRLQAKSPQKTDEEKLAGILRRTCQYCERLEKASLDFVCIEEITEKIDFSRDRSDAIYLPLGGIRTQIKIPKLKEEKSYIYDYQFIQRGPVKKEKRVLLEKNGKKVCEEDAQLETSFVRVENVLMGPVGLLGQYMQGHHDYRLIGEEMVNEENTAVLEAIPKPTLNRPHCYGKIWVSEKDFSVLKIAWEQKSIGNYAVLEERAKTYKADPVITLVSEYGFEKNGLRFPSRDFSEEAYVDEKGRRFVRTQTSIIYKDYKFFIVDVTIQY